MGILEVLFGFSLPAVVSCTYLGSLGILSRRQRQVKEPICKLDEFPHFTFVVPAHNESVGIESTIKSLFAVDYPLDRFNVVVVADNCTDNTAQLATAAGATVLERNDSTRRGKGYALEFAFEKVLKSSPTDALVVVDADTDVDANLLMCAANAIANGEIALQAHYAVKNVEDSWRTRLMDVAFTLYHGVRSQARERMKVSVGLRGNGMVFSREALVRVPYKAYSLVEDVEYGMELGLAGIRVAYLGDTAVRAEMVISDDASVSQRKRWELGRRQLILNFVPKLLYRGLRQRDWVMLDLAFDALTPPLASIVLFTLGGTLVSMCFVAAGLTQPIVLLPWGVSIIGLAGYVSSGISLSGRGANVLSDLKHAPRYVIWKLSLKLRKEPQKTGAWVRTTRNQESSAKPL